MTDDHDLLRANISDTMRERNEARAESAYHLQALTDQAREYDARIALARALVAIGRVP